MVTVAAAVLVTLRIILVQACRTEGYIQAVRQSIHIPGKGGSERMTVWCLAACLVKPQQPSRSDPLKRNLMCLLYGTMPSNDHQHPLQAVETG